MNSKTTMVALLAAACIAGPAWAQPPYAKPVREVIGDRTAEPLAPPQTEPGSRWISSGPCLCDGGESPPIAAEVYFRTGISTPFASSFNHHDLLGRDMRAGFLYQLGIRTLFFDVPATRAWAIDVSLSHVDNGQDPDVGYPLAVIDFTGNTDPTTGQPEVKRIQFGTPIEPPIHIRDTHRTYLNLGFGRDTYWNASAEDSGRRFRVGWDVGARYGALSQEYDRIKHRTDVIGGLYAGAHADFEWSTSWGAWHAGVRCEYSYTWSDILQRASDIQEINTLLTVGIRY